jgi:hypothetical protein
MEKMNLVFKFSPRLRLGLNATGVGPSIVLIVAIEK